MSKGIKWTIIVSIICLIVVGIGLLLYFFVFNKDSLKITAVEHTTYKASDFKKSEMRLYSNGTFHIEIIYSENEVFFIGVGTYTKKDSTYKLTFSKAVGRKDQVISDVTSHFTKPLDCNKSGTRIKFTDHNNQVYYFG